MSYEKKLEELMNNVNPILNAEDFNKCKNEYFKLLENLHSPDDLRIKGFTVAVHNDYSLNEEDFTFWLMTKKYNNVTLAFKGEGKTDEEALNQIREQVINFKE